MERYVLKVTYERGGTGQALQIITQALTDEETLRAAHPLIDFAEWNGATNVIVSVSSVDGREVGTVGDYGTGDVWMDRPTTRAPSYIGE